MDATVGNAICNGCSQNFKFPQVSFYDHIIIIVFVISMLILLLLYMLKHTRPIYIQHI